MLAQLPAGDVERLPDGLGDVPRGHARCGLLVNHQPAAGDADVESHVREPSRSLLDHDAAAGESRMHLLERLDPLGDRGTEGVGGLDIAESDLGRDIHGAALQSEKSFCCQWRRRRANHGPCPNIPPDLDNACPIRILAGAVGESQ